MLKLRDNNVKERIASGTRRCAARRKRAGDAAVRAVGFALLEVLVTMVILLVGLLGLAGIMARASSAEMESYQRVQGLLLLDDMVDRINANRKYATCYSDGATGRTLGTGYLATPTCAGSGSLTLAGELALAASDLSAWDGLLKGAAEQDTGGNTFGAMIGARGCIKQLSASSPERYSVSVAWQGLNKTVVPTDTCGSGAYGDEARRRVVTRNICIGYLGATPLALPPTSC